MRTMGSGDALRERAERAGPLPVSLLAASGPLEPESTWAEDVAAAQATGAAVHAPNGLPILCIRHDSVTLEHEHADHPDYRFPVEVEYIGDHSIFAWCTADGEVPMTPEEIENERTQTHALIYSDGIVAVTMHECTYATWLVQTGECIGGRSHKGREWKLTAAARARIAAPRSPQTPPPSSDTLPR